MSLVCLSLGSNADPATHLGACFEALKRTFDSVRISRVFESEPVGCQAAANFFNAVVAFESDWSPEALNEWTNAQEAALNPRVPRERHAPKALDIDLLSVGDTCADFEGFTLPREDITHYAFVLRPLAELLPNECHPRCKTPYATLFARADFSDQPLWPVAFSFRGMAISP
ncbi:MULTISPECIES: 2-amino-4-hydroxy-6-hydroxymethyldihydropteridine diphosphokinase [unclassified Halomonas]|uniref:2-amino-4-hydroxy-6- hydroxymethyldihydropteridine diphosphokinase n=1 Tax=unclassified Halomonas TaxID=2609666 RepID=UPI0020769514|nr:2-amino-4-hydroxy-6-hydroxymethyldihydropteridine diphosphokinase [Halomonas sp. S3-1-8]